MKNPYDDNQGPILYRFSVFTEVDNRDTCSSDGDDDGVWRERVQSEQPANGGVWREGR